MSWFIIADPYGAFDLEGPTYKLLGPFESESQAIDWYEVNGGWEYALATIVEAEDVTK